MKKLVTLLFMLQIIACGGQDSGNGADSIPTDAPVNMQAAGESIIFLDPLPGKEDLVPELTQKSTLLMQTGSGEIVIEIYPEAAPNAAARFLELVDAGFYDNTPVFRVVPDFVAQFGINWRDNYPLWQDKNFDDDPSLFALERGTLAFAKAGPNTNSTQVFINTIENNRLAEPRYNFTVFGKVVSGMEAVDAFIPVGDPGGGLDQGRLWNDGAAYLDSLATKPIMIESVSIVGAGVSP